MECVRTALIQAAEELGLSQVESPRLTAELLMARVLGWERVRVLAHPESPLPPGAAERFFSLVRRRTAGEPLQYILGEQEFYGFPFRVTPAVLIPRPETEILVEQAVLAARETGPRRLRFVDVGTGSGCIAVSFAREIPQAEGWAADISIEALAVARENAARNGVQERVGLLLCDLLEGFAPRPCFDLVLSNPPYVAVEDAELLPKVVREHEPPIALYSGASGLGAYRRLIPQAAARLVPGGRLLLELGAGVAGQVSGLAERAGLSVETIVGDLQGIPRCLIARRGHG